MQVHTEIQPIGDALAKGINRTSVEVDSINCEFTSNDVLIKSIQNADGYLIDLLHWAVTPQLP